VTKDLPNEPQLINVNIARVLLDPIGVPKATQKVFWTRVGPDVVVEMACFDMLQLLAAIEHAKSGSKEPPPEVRVFITDRFLMSVPAFLEFADGATIAAKAIRSEIEAEQKRR
jgi:hypothetical protein